ncbi:phage tail length tape measure family protein [Bradyrhizobium liaoningense]
MSTDIARLGLAIDSGPVTAANTALDKFQASANAAAAGADKLQAATKTTGANVVAIGKSAATADKALQSVAKSTGLARHELVNLSRQIQDVGVSLASGQSPFTVLAQQGTQIADIFGSSKTGTVGGALRQIGSGIASVITPARLLVGGLGAVAIAGVALFKWTANSAKQFDDVSRSVGATTTQLHSLQQAAAGRGIGQDDFFKGMQEFGANVYQAKNNMGVLGTLFRANGVTAKGFSDSMEKAADLIKNAKDDQQRLVLLQQMGLPATMEWVRFMSQGAEGIRAATKAAVEFDATAEGKLVKRAREFDEVWNRVWTNWTNNAKSAATQIVAAIDEVIQKGSKADFGKNIDFGEIATGNKTPGQDKIAANASFNERFGSFQSPSNNTALQTALSPQPTKTTVDPNVEATNIARAQARIGLLGQLATVEDQVRAKELELAAAGLQGVGVSKQQAEAIKNIVRAQAELQRVSEQAAYGIFNFADAQKAANDNLQSLIDRKLLDPNNAQQYAAAVNSAQKSVEALADQAKVAGSALPMFQQALNDAGNARKQLDSLMTEGMSVNRGFFVEFGQQIRSGASAWDAFKDAGLNALGKLSDKLMQMAADNLFASAFGGSSSGGLAGAIGSLFGVGGTGTVANGGIVLGGASGPGVFAAANGGTFGPGWGVVGERGPELINVHKGGVTVVPNHVSKPFLPGFADGGTMSPNGMVSRLAAAGGGGGNSPSVQITQNNDFRGSDPGSEARQRQYVDQSRKMAVQEAVQAVRTVQSQNPAYLRGGR